MDEREALSRLKHGDIDALEFLVLKYEGRALRVAYLVTQDRSLAQDVAQDAFLRVFDRASQFDERRPFSPWFLKIVVNDALKVVEKRNRIERHRSRDEEAIKNFIDVTTNPELGLELVEIQTQMRQALKILSPSQRALIVQRYYLDLSESQIALQRGISIGSVKQLLHRARRRLRSALVGQ